MRKRLAVLSVVAIAVAGGAFAVRHMLDEIVESLRGNIPRRTVSIVRCPELRTRNVRVDHLGHQSNGSYETGLRLAYEEFPPSVLEARRSQLGNMGRGGIDGHQVYYSIPIDRTGNPMIAPPPSFHESGTDEQKILYDEGEYPNDKIYPEEYIKYYTGMFKKEYTIIGYEYQFIDGDGAHYRSPYFDIMEWNEGGHISTSRVEGRQIERFIPDFSKLSDMVTQMDIWRVPGNEECDQSGFRPD
ncbi:MAG: hypothetical protein ACK5MQ_17445 [Pikeienuella sp.]